MREEQSQKNLREAAESEKRLPDPSLPRRYRLYDKIKDHVSLRAVDTVIVITALLIIGFLIYGIITANPA